jgi:hypothetical protein
MIEVRRPLAGGRPPEQSRLVTNPADLTTPQATDFGTPLLSTAAGTFWSAVWGRGSVDRGGLGK